MLSFLKPWLPGCAPSRQRPASRPRCVPQLLTLEDRLVPAAPVIGYDASGLMHAFVIGLDSQVWEQDFNAAGHSTSGYALTTPGQVKKIGLTYDGVGYMHLFAIGLDDQVYEQDFGYTGHSISNYQLTSPGGVKDFSLGHNAMPSKNIELFAIGLDDQIYEQDFGGYGHSIGSYVLTSSGQVNSGRFKKMDVGYDAVAGLMHLFALGMDDQVYQQDFGFSGHADSGYFLTTPGRVKDFWVGHNNGPYMNIELFVLGLDNQIYEQDFTDHGHSTSLYFLTAPGAVKQIGVGYDAGGLMHLFAIGMDNQVYEQDFGINGHSTSSYYLTKPGQVKDLGLASEFSGYHSTGHNTISDTELLVVGLDNQVYEQDFGPDGHSISSYFLTAPGQVQAV